MRFQRGHPVRDHGLPAWEAMVAAAVLDGHTQTAVAARYDTTPARVRAIAARTARLLTRRTV